MVRLKETYLKGLLLTQLYFIRGSVIAYNKKTALWTQVSTQQVTQF